MNQFRLILDPPRSATLNMAIDEYLMECQSLAGDPPVLRLYSWIEPAYSIGYFQSVSKIAERFECEKKNIPIVRRITGGGLVLHGRDLTFSIAVKAGDPFFAGEAKDSYLRVHEALRVGLKPLYPELDYADCRSLPSGRAGKERVCFESPACHDLLLHGKKIAGASQRRKNNSILHQSSVFLDGDRDVLIQGILAGFREKWKIDLFEEPLSENELLAVRQKEGRYVSGQWSFLPALERSFLS